MRTLLIVVVFAGFVAYVIYSTTGLDQVSCEVCIDYKGAFKCASASGTTEEEARGTATTVACAALSSGVTDSINCENTPPRSAECRAR